MVYSIVIVVVIIIIIQIAIIMWFQTEQMSELLRKASSQKKGLCRISADANNQSR